MFNHLLGKINFTVHRNQKEYEAIKALRKFMQKHEYDSDAFIQDIDDVIIEEMDKNISNIYNICDDKKYISHCKDFLQVR